MLGPEILKAAFLGKVMSCISLYAQTPNVKSVASLCIVNLHKGQCIHSVCFDAAQHERRKLMLSAMTQRPMAVLAFRTPNTMEI